MHEIQGQVEVLKLQEAEAIPENIVISGCTDAIRPVVFKIERIED
jgi:uncharacterized repeat protein (TIGR04076 family)